MSNQRKIRVGAVSYLNTKPLIYGIEQGLMKNDIELINDYPSRIAGMLLNDEIDLGLVPVTIIPRLQYAQMITDYCIGCEGEIASVCIFSDLPLTDIKKILLDYQSQTSVALVRILLHEYWNLSPILQDTAKDFEEHIQGTTAGLVIGDRAFEQRKISPYAYDLGYAWTQYTGMPFIFAAWVSNKKLDDDFIRAFNEANKAGLEKINEVVTKNPYHLFDLKKYYTEHISYYLNDSKMKGLKLFFEKLSKFQF